MWKIRNIVSRGVFQVSDSTPINDRHPLEHQEDPKGAERLRTVYNTQP
jgi:hypothetical protein